ncbi:MAG: hypothetical protein HQM10_02795 [Candidatus Riflebacteria bacterium]|nr:hypothetical protein [Candidatus Riflebacteria bacterium]
MKNGSEKSSEKKDVIASKKRSWRTPEITEVDYTVTLASALYVTGTDGGIYS